MENKIKLLVYILKPLKLCHLQTLRLSPTLFDICHTTDAAWIRYHWHSSSPISVAATHAG